MDIYLFHYIKWRKKKEFNNMKLAQEQGVEVPWYFTLATYVC